MFNVRTLRLVTAVVPVLLALPGTERGLVAVVSVPPVPRDLASRGWSAVTGRTEACVVRAPLAIRETGRGMAAHRSSRRVETVPATLVCPVQRHHQGSGVGSARMVSGYLLIVFY